MLDKYQKVKLSICTYHKKDDEEKIRNIFKNSNITTSTGYIVWIFDQNIKYPYFRRGVLKINYKK
ncbi:MAG: hypothetical protein PHP12_02715 [Bacilli bacterium]|nr:hypothetical protein [Bacilli bacterium]